MIGPVAVLLGGAPIIRRTTKTRPDVVVALVVAAAVAPVPAGATAFLVWSIARFRRAAARSAASRDREDAALEVAELVALGLAGGLSIAAAHRVARTHAPAPIVVDIDRLLGEMERSGTGPALAAASGPLRDTCQVLLAASASGAPALPALESHLALVQHRRHSAAVERARRLPVRLLVPLTLIVLPGFVLITVGPTVIDSLARLGP